MEISNEAIKEDAIKFIVDKKTDWETATCYITDKISFQMREVIKQCRKNYWGIFNTPNDEDTGQAKTFVPLTESIVDTDVKNREIDTKDLVFKSKKASRTRLNILIREIVREELRKVNFGEKLDLEARTLSIDGTVVWKTVKNMVDEKSIAEIKNVDILNFYIDPTAETIQETPLVIERSVMTLQEVRDMDGWDNTADLEGSEDISANNAMTGTSDCKTGVKMVELYEAWGLIPKYFITGKEKDNEEDVEGHIVISKNKGSHTVHLIELNDNGIKPYEEDRYIRVQGRWYGKGIAEKLLMLQSWQNIIVNVRINRARVSQLGLFKLKKGTGITSQLFSKLSANGIIPLDNLNDLEQLVVKEASEASYRDEQVVQTWAERVTSAFEMVSGEQIPATTTATIGAIQSQSAKSQFVLIKKQTGMFIERVLRRHFLPIVSKNIKRGDIVRISLDVDELREIDEQFAEAMAINQVQKYGGEYESVRQSIFDKLQTKGKDRFIKLGKNVDLLDYDLTLAMSNEDIDKNLIITNLLNMMRVAPQYQEQIVQKVFDILGFSFKSIAPALPEQIMQGGSEGEEVKPNQSSLDQLTNAITK